MPMARIAMRAGKPDAYRAAILDGVHGALREALGLDAGNRFAVLDEYPAANFRRGDAYGVARSDDLIYIQITLFDTRTVEQKKALFAQIVRRLGAAPGLRPEDVFVSLLPTAKDNWSVGHGLAQFA